MRLNTGVEAVKVLGRALVSRAQEARAVAPLLVGRPALIARWLATARTAQIVLAVTVLCVSVLLPQLLDEMLPRLYPEITSEKKLFGIIKTTERTTDPRVETRRCQILTLAGLSGSAMALFLLWIHLPDAIAAAERAARRSEREADALTSVDLSRSQSLYRSALRITTDPSHETELREKLRAVELAVGQAWADHAPGSETIISPVSPASRTSRIGPGARYRIEAELARGGMGVVYRGHDGVLDRPVALKQLLVELSTTADLVRRFQQEARALARLTHPNIVQVHDLVEHQGRWWIAMELVEGGDLSDLLTQHGALSVPAAALLGTQTARALAFAHSRGVLHRDVKPVNILLTTEGVPKLTDFGLAKLLESGTRTQVGSLLGSPAYMSPEQAAGEPADERSDLYSLGITLYEMLIGRVPFEGDTAAVLAKHITSPPPTLRELAADIPPQLEGLVLEMLAKRRDERPVNMAEVADRLVAFAKSP